MDTDPDKRFKLAEAKQVPKNGAIIVFGPDGEEIALFHVAGKYYAISNVCPHEGGPLGEGEIDNTTVTCPWHSWQFDIKTGKCINNVGEEVKTYPIQIHDGIIYIRE